ncbi:MAG: ATP-binding protein [Bacteroidota bacterium]|jgi:Histidine kinase-, DNA gyrase B-, and HSP90-like ATPase
MKYWDKYVQYYIDHCSTPDVSREDGLPYLRNKLFISILILAFPICVVASIPSMITCIRTEQLIIGIFDTLAFVVSVIMTMLPFKSIHVEFFLEYPLVSWIGIPDDHHQAIFERFVQADIDDLQARQGAGLGLYISKSYVEMLNGRIWVESEPGQGSSFHFSIPYLK